MTVVGFLLALSAAIGGGIAKDTNVDVFAKVDLAHHEVIPDGKMSNIHSTG